MSECHNRFFEFVHFCDEELDLIRLQILFSKRTLFDNTQEGLSFKVGYPYALTDFNTKDHISSVVK